MMQKFFTVLICILIYLPNLKAQYVNTDSLIILPGHENPLSIIQYDSIFFMSPDTDVLSGEEHFFDESLLAGQLLRDFIVPSNGKVISKYGLRSGRMHTGIDLKMDRGDTIFASYYGVVTRAKYYYGYGNMVVIDHGSNIETSYAHLSAYLVKPGDQVRRGQPVGLAGSTGRATTNHLHFEIREKDRHFNPELVFDFNSGKVRDEVNHINQLADLKKEAQQAVQPVMGPVPQHYTVRSGDNLWKIARRYKTTVQILCQLNNLNQNSVLNVGTTLKLY
jgi:hypothetical protein